MKTAVDFPQVLEGGYARRVSRPADRFRDESRGSSAPLNPFTARRQTDQITRACSGKRPFIIFLSVAVGLWLLVRLFTPRTEEPWYFKNSTRFPEQCGRSSVDKAMARSKGGDEATPGEWPWMVSFEIFHNGKFGHACGGVLLSDEWMLTAGHCVSNMTTGRPNPVSHFRIRLGAHDRTVVEEHEILTNVGKSIPYPLYKFVNYDIALVKLSKRVELSNRIGTICMPGPTDNFDKQTCVITGWGTQGQKGRLTPKLQMLVEPMLECSGIKEFQLCAGTRTAGKGICRGDSGGPLQCLKADGRWYLVGLASWTVGCAWAVPDVFTRVTYFLDWIYETVATN